MLTEKKNAFSNDVQKMCCPITVTAFLEAGAHNPVVACQVVNFKARVLLRLSTGCLGVALVDEGGRL